MILTILYNIAMSGLADDVAFVASFTIDDQLTNTNSDERINNSYFYWNHTRTVFFHIAYV